MYTLKLKFIFYLLSVSIDWMGKNKKGFNWRARSQLPGNVDLSQARALEGKVLQDGHIKPTTGGGFEVRFCKNRK